MSAVLELKRQPDNKKPAPTTAAHDEAMDSQAAVRVLSRRFLEQIPADAPSTG